MADTSASIPSVPSIPSVAAPPPPPPVTTGLLTRSHAQKVEALTAVPITPPAGSSTSTYAGKGKKHAVPPEDSPEVETHSNKGDTPQKVTEMRPGIAVPSVLVEGASPPRPKVPATVTFALHRLSTYHMSWNYHVIMTSLVLDISTTFHMTSM
jgi:hypothetical protein